MKKCFERCWLLGRGAWEVPTFDINIDNELKKWFSYRGVPGFELLAMELKMTGSYVSRQLSNDGVDVKPHIVEPSINFLCCYRRATELVKVYTNKRDVTWLNLYLMQVVYYDVLVVSIMHLHGLQKGGLR